MTGGTVCVVGSFMMDLVVDAPRRPEAGETIMGTNFHIFPGGKGFNQAIAASRAGAHTTFVGRLGDDDFAHSFRMALKDEGIDASMVRADDTQGTGVGLPVVEPDGQNSIVIVPRANLSVTVQDIRDSSSHITEADVLLLQLELPLDAVQEAAKIARAGNTRIILNPAPYALLPDDLLCLADVIVPNETELLALCGGESAAIEEVRTLASALATRTGADIVVTLGSRGVAVFRQGEEPIEIDSHRVKSVDTVGAGDVFCGNLGAALAGGDDLTTAVITANAAAAIAVTRRGGGNSAPHISETEELIHTYAER